MAGTTSAMNPKNRRRVFPQEGAALGLTCETPTLPPMGKNTHPHKRQDIRVMRHVCHAAKCR